MSAGPRNVINIIRSPGSNLSSLIARCGQLQDLQRILVRELALDDPFAVRAAALRGDRLVVHVGNGAWATKLRYQAADLSRRLSAASGHTINGIEIRVRPMARTPAPKPPPRQLGPKAARSLQSAAATVEDPRLADALTRLAARAGRNPDSA